MKKVLITGGTTFVSRYAAEYYIAKGYRVSVLNRNTKPQPAGVTLIQADRHALGTVLQDQHFDVIFDITAYTGDDINGLLDAVGSFDDYIMVSSSAVYPGYLPQPFTEDTPTGPNRFWGKYGTDKIAAEEVLLQRVPQAYILRPPYLYGPMNNVYRESFVFDCALWRRPFYLPGDGSMPLQFFHVEDLCRFMDVLLEKKPEKHIFNVGNQETVSVLEWVRLCYTVAGVPLETVNVRKDIDQRNYFSFYNYAYWLDVALQEQLMPSTKPLSVGLKEALEWYVSNQQEVKKKPYFDYIDRQLTGKNAAK